MGDPRSGDLDDNEATMDGGSGIVADIGSVIAGRPKLITHDQGRPLSQLPTREPLHHHLGREDGVMARDDETSGLATDPGDARDSHLPRPRPIPHPPDPKPSGRAARLNEIRGRIEERGTSPEHADEPGPQDLPAPPAAELIAEVPEPPVILKLEDIVLPAPPEDLGSEPFERDQIRSSNLSSGPQTGFARTTELRREKRSLHVGVLLGLGALLLMLIVIVALGYSRGVGV